MKTLIQGCESAEQFEVLLKLTGITSENKKNALRAYLVEGLPAKRAYARFHVTQQHFSQALMLLNKKADLAMQYATLQKSKGEQNFDELRRRIIEAKSKPDGGYQQLFEDIIDDESNLRIALKNRKRPGNFRRLFIDEPNTK